MYFKAQSVVDWAFSLCDTQKCLYQAEKRREEKRREEKRREEKRREEKRREEKRREEKRWDEIETVACRQGEFINGTKARTLFLV
ncbi:hypothetical protein BCU33_022350 [Vibrio lentus]|uniref:hypothetical protein n=1 Tax=Vibrio lentus TaxID=136468 RepID=UPI0039A459E5